MHFRGAGRSPRKRSHRLRRERPLLSGLFMLAMTYADDGDPALVLAICRKIMQSPVCTTCQHGMYRAYMAKAAIHKRAMITTRSSWLGLSWRPC